MTYRWQRTRRPSAVGTASYRCLTTPSSRYRPAGGRMEQLRVPPEMFRFTHADRADLYVSMLHAFGEANERLETSLGLDDVRARLRSIGWLDALDDDDLTAALGQLRLWNLIDVIQNHAVDYRTASEYERRNLQYSLTRQGEAALAGVTHAMMMLASTGALQTAVLDAIADRLRDLIHEMEHGSDRRIFTALTELEGHLEALRGNTKQFNGELQRLLRADGTDLATFHDVKAATVAYLQEFLTNLDRRSHAIATGIREVEEHGVGLLHKRALLSLPDPELAGSSMSWRDAPPVEVSPLLRSAGRAERFSRTGRVRDVKAIKAARAERARAERAELEAAWSMLDTDGTVRLAAFGRLDHALFERLLELLGRALASSPDSSGLRRGSTAD